LSYSNRAYKHRRSAVPSQEVLAWMDLEMTGLDPSVHSIVEIATLITDDDLNVLAVGPDIVIAATDEQLATMDDFVLNMHTHSGLLQAIKESNVSLEEAGNATLDFLRQHIPDKGTIPLAGNSIGTDRRFLAAYLPEIEDWLHYRCVDVSTVKELCKRWYPDALTKAPSKVTAHRAMDDIRESLAELAFYREAMFREVGKAGAPEPKGASIPSTSRRLQISKFFRR